VEFLPIAILERRIMHHIDDADENVTLAQAALDDARFHDAVRYARETWKAVDTQTEESRSALEIWMQGSLIESQAWDYLDCGERAQSTACRSLKRASRRDRGGQWYAKSVIRLIETEEWRQNVARASLAYLRLASKLETIDWGQPLALVCYYQMISCRLKGASPDVSETAIALGKILLSDVKSDDLVGSFKRWQAVDLADRADESHGALDKAAVLLRESQDLKPLDLNRRVRIGESFPLAFLKFACEAPDAEVSLEGAIDSARAVGLRQYVRGSELLLARFRD
jgi:hypothetical protein